jgi:hypothetical protein
MYDCNGTNAQKWTVGNTDTSIQALGKCLDVTGGGTADGTKIQLYTCNGTGAQKWTVTSAGQLINVGSGRCLDATKKSSANGNQLQIWSCSGASNQKWVLPAGATTPPTTTPVTTAPATTPPATTPAATTPAATTPAATTPPATTPPVTTPPATPTPTPSTPVTSMTLPIRATFYYPWYPENFADGAASSHYVPSAGYYNGDDPAVVDRQIQDMQYGGLQAGIASWWGQGTREDKRLALLMTEATKLKFSWTAYYEDEGFGDPTSAQISSDLTYLKKYSDSPTWLHINGKPVIFAYGDGNDKCGMVDRWASANTSGYYVVLKVFGGYRDCAVQPQGWHQYAPGGPIDVQTGYSVVVSPGFFKNDTTTPLLARDPARFKADLTTAATSKAPFQLVTTYNEWGEGTSVESTTAWPSASGHGVYVDIMHDVFGANPR